MRRYTLIATLACVLAGHGHVFGQAKPWDNLKIDSEYGCWRVFPVWKTPELLSGDGTPRPLLERPRRGLEEKDRKPVPVSRSAAPPEKWRQPDFDDSDWAWVRGPVGGGRSDLWEAHNANELCAICIRGNFEVKDPAKATDLQVFVKYVGGVVIYVNGVEIKRQHLPKGREIALDTLADPYPTRAYLTPDGFLLLGDKDFKSDEVGEGFQAYLEKYRGRSVEAAVKPDRLRQGVNVVAIEIHRAPLNEIQLTSKYKTPPAYGGEPWGHAEAQSCVLRSAYGLTTAKAVPSTVAAPEGVKVWTREATTTKMVLNEHGDAAAAASPIRLVATRGGAYCGVAVIESNDALTQIKAEMTDLRGPGTIPSSAVEVFYALPDGAPPGYLRWPPTFDTLRADPPETVAVDRQTETALQPVWIKVRVPRAAAAGDYAATLTISVNGDQTFPVPVKLKVHDWTLPEPKNYASFVDLVQSPETIAIKYETPIWSDEHFKRLEPSLKLLGEIGNKTAYIRLITRTHFGDTVAMLRFVKDGQGWKRDYSVLERYLDLVEKHQGKPLVTVLYCNERYTSGGQKAYVTEYDPAAKTMKEIEAPGFGGEAGKAFWGPVFKELRELAAKRGLEKTLMIGAGGDFTGPRKEFVELMKEIAPGMPWVYQGHGAAGAVHGVPVGYGTTVWNASGPEDPRTGRRRQGWRGGESYYCQFPRDMFNWIALPVPRNLVEWNLTGGQRGVGRLGGDFWPVLKDAPAAGRYWSGNMLTARYQGGEGGWGQLVLRTCYLGPGKDGAAPTARFEAMREGVQECEARIFVEGVLLDPAKRAKLGDALAEQAQAILDERTVMLANPNYWQGEGWRWAGTRDRADRLYDLCRELTLKMNAK